MNNVIKSDHAHRIFSWIIAFIVMLLGAFAGGLVLLANGLSAIFGLTFIAIFLWVFANPITYIYIAVTISLVYDQWHRGLSLRTVFFGRVYSSKANVSRFTFILWTFVPVIGAFFFAAELPSTVFGIVLIALLNIVAFVLMHRYYAKKVKQDKQTRSSGLLFLRSVVYGFVYGHIIFLIGIVVLFYNSGYW